MRIKPSLIEYCVKKTESEIRNQINYANEKILSTEIVYEDLFTVNKNADEEVCLIQANSGLINQISMLWGTEIQNGLNENDSFILTDSMGIITGSPFLSRFGRTIQIKCNYAATSRTEYRSEFVKRGVNQTLHRLYLVAYVEVKLLAPVKSETFVIDDAFLFSETIINGKVPGTYISSENYLDYLDLLE